MGRFKSVRRLISTLKSVGELKSKQEIASINLSSRSSLLALAKTPETKDFVEQQYRLGATIGNGSTADAVRHELATGKLVGGKSHLIKAQNAINHINNVLRDNPNHPDRALLLAIKEDLQKALRGD